MPFTHSLPLIPEVYLQRLPQECQQIIVVTAVSPHSTDGKIWLLEADLQKKPDTNHSAFILRLLGPEKVTLGRKGLALGHGHQTMGSPSPSGSLPLKREGDQRSPIGVFAIPFAFGSSQSITTRMPYHQMTPHHAGVDDPSSKFYNQIVDARIVTPDWSSAESMLPSGGCYELGLFVAHNPANHPHAGSCIFMHLWAKPGEPTSGCTAMDRKTLTALLERLRPDAHPHLVQFVTSD